MPETILSAIDTEIAKLQQARRLLTDASATPAVSEAKRRGRPKGTNNAAKTAAVKTAPAKAKRTMSAEGKARIAEAQKKRWAEQKKAAKKAA